MKNESKIKGIPRPNAKVIPFFLFDVGLKRFRSWAEEQVVFFIARHTCGWDKPDGDWISHGQIVNGFKAKKTKQPIALGVRVRKPAVLRGLKQGIKDGWILRDRRCRTCDQTVKRNEVQHIRYEVRKGRDKGKEREYERKVVPYYCPHCGARLRGNEKIWYSLNWQENAEDDA